MKFESDTEIDRLLRRHTRRGGAAAPAAQVSARVSNSDDDGAATSRVSGAHLDADEMNAYAEGALPESSRTRYVAHLADCDECRGLVTKLTLAAGGAATERATAAATVPAVASRSWRDWLAALFAPPVLRYAVPALALAVVMVVAFVATRQQRKADLVAQNEQRQNSSAPESAAENEQAPSATTTNTTVIPNGNTSRGVDAAAPVFNQNQAGAPTAANAPAQKKEDAEQNAPPPASEPKPTAEQPVADGVFGKRADGSYETVTPMKAPALPPPRPTPAVKSPREDDKAVEEEAAQKSADTAEKRKAAPPATGAASGGILRDRAAASRSQTNAQPAQESGRRESQARRSRPASPQLSSEAAGPEDKDERGGATRSVGGRQFRRQGGIWVDTAYNSSRSTVSVARGSEQYRALVADEPGIRTVADQLDGTVIVVWKNRAYRIY